MKVLFVYIDAQASSGYTTGLGIASISGYLKKYGIETDLVYYKTENDYNYALIKIGKFVPNIIGFYSTASGWSVVNKLSHSLKLKFPKIFQIYGGVHATLCPEVLFKSATLDAVCIGYGEYPMLQLCKMLEKASPLDNLPGLLIRKNLNKEIINTIPPYFPDTNQDEFMQFDHMLFLDELKRFEDFNKDSYVLEIIFNRGCPFKCTFCSNHKLNQIYKNRYFLPSPDASIDALKLAIKNTGLRIIEIHDDIFTLNKKWFRNFIKRYAKEIGLPFICNLRTDTFDEEDIQLLKEANIHTAWIGVESGNNYIRNEVMKKGISRDALLDAFELLHKYEVQVITQNIIGVPEETPDHFLDTIRLNAELKPKDSCLSVFYPYSGTKLYDKCVSENLIDNKDRTILERTDTILNLPNFSSEKIRFYFEHFKTLICYEQKRLNEPEKYSLTLSDENSKKIVIQMNHNFGNLT